MTGTPPQSPAAPAGSSVGAVHAAVRVFDARADAAALAAPPSKAWVRAAVRRQGAPRPPVRLRRLSVDIVLRHGDLLGDLFTAYPDDVQHIQPYDMTTGWQGGPGVALDLLTLLTTDARWIDEWGTGWEHAVGGAGASPVSAPLASWADLEGWLERSLPDPGAPGRLDGAIPTVRSLGPTRWTAATTHQAIWERYNQLRGMESAFEDLVSDEPEVDRLLDVITEYGVEIIRRWPSAGLVDAIFLTDDWGTQLGLMCSPATWRRLFGPRYRRLCDAAHALGLDVVFHSCGNIHELLPDLVDVGVDVIDPLQPEAMDLGRVARELGGQVAFAGGIPVQRLPAMSPAAVRDEVARLREVLAAPFGNALILAPSNSLLADVPADNLVALFEACHAP